MEKPSLKDYYFTKEDGSQEFNSEQYEKDLNTYVEESKRQASETAKKKGIEEGKRQAQDEAKLSAEEKFAKDKAEWENQIKSKTIEFNKRLVKEIYKNKGFGDDEIEVLLDLVNDDEKSSLERATKLCDSRKKYEDNYQKKFAEEVQKKQDSQSGSGSKNDGEMSFGKKFAQEQNKEFDAFHQTNS